VVVPVHPWVTVSGRVVLPNDRDVPPPKEVGGQIRDADHNRKNGPVIDGTLLVNPANRGVRNAVVWLRPDSDDPKAAFPKDRVHPDLANPKPRDREVVVNCCQFEPRVTAARLGDTMVFRNRSAISHNVNCWHYLGAAGEQEFNVLVRPDTDYRPERPLVASTGPRYFRCGIHVWMKGFIWVFDHPYFAVTDADGRFEIPNAPLGDSRVVVWHEKVGYRDGRAGRLGHPLTLTAPDAGPARHHLPAVPLDSEAWDRE
jgi:plastocyanin